MTRGAYRDHFAGLAARVEERRARVAELEARVEFPALARIDPSEHERLASLARAALSRDVHPHNPLGAPDETNLEHAETHLARYETALRTLLGRAPDLELLAQTPFGEPADIPIPSNSWQSPGTFYGAVLDEIHELGDTLRRALGHVSSFTFDWVEPPMPAMFTGRAVLRASFTSGLTPMKLLVVVTARSDLPLFRTTIATNIPRAAPPLLALPRTALGPRLVAFFSRKVTGFGAEMTTGDPELDATFAVRSPDPTAVLGRIARSRMLDLSRFDVPTLRCADGQATLAYTYDPEPTVLRTALDLLSRLHATQVPISILKGE